MFGSVAVIRESGVNSLRVGIFTWVICPGSSASGSRSLTTDTAGDLRRHQHVLLAVLWRMLRIISRRLAG